MDAIAAAIIAVSYVVIREHGDQYGTFAGHCGWRCALSGLVLLQDLR